MEIVDEIMTPGCPNCYIKHLTAALACMAINMFDYVRVPYADVTVARALINLVEAREGYVSHRDLAIGLLAHAEIISMDDGCVNLREIRVGLMTGDPDAERRLLGRVSPEALFVAHLKEAERELPDGPLPVAMTCELSCVVIPSIDQRTADGILSSIAEVRKEYFDLPTVGEETTTKEEGGQEMACAKKTAVKKAPAKATQAACKGGKCSTKKSCKK